MLIDCPTCDRSYHVSRDEIGGCGRTVICPCCQTQWFVDGDGRTAHEVVVAAVSRRVEADARPTRPSIRRKARPVLAATACVALAAGLIGARDRIVRLAPRLARLYEVAGLPVNVRGLAFEKVATSRVDRVRVAVSGEIRNVAQRRVAVPRLVYEVRDAAGADLVRWSERGPARALASGQTITFAAAPHDMPPGAATVLVHFEP